MKVICGIQARSTSTRLPGKIFLPLGNTTVLEEVYNQCYLARRPEWVTQYDVKILGPIGDTKLIEFCEDKCLPYALGSMNDLVERYFEASEGYDYTIRVTSDCPLIPTSIVETTMAALEHADYVTNVNPRTFPDGWDCQGASYEALRWVWRTQQEIEHPFLELDTDESVLKKFRETFKATRIINDSRVILNPFVPENKISIDTQEDYERVRSLYERKHMAPSVEESVGSK